MVIIKKKTTVKNFMPHVFIFAHSANFTLKTFANDLLLIVKNKRKKIEISWILIMCLLLMATQYEKIPYILDFFSSATKSGTLEKCLRLIVYCKSQFFAI